MKVYTHFYLMDENTAIGFRWRTLLQYGNSWEVIGSVVMKNPGGAKFKSPTHQAIDDAETLRQLRHFDESKDKWYEFGSDTTIDCVGDLFAFYYDLPRREDLNGVIQIFNLFYIKEADLSKALVYSEATSNTFRFADEENVTNYDIEHLVPPVYLGFGNLAWHKRYNQKAEQFFNAAINKCGMKYLDPIFQHNNFTHPLYLMRYAKNKPKYIRYRMKFKQNTLIPTGVENAISDARSTLSKHIPNMERAKRQEQRQKIADEVFNHLKNQKGYQVVAIKDKNGISLCNGAVRLVINSNKNEAVHLFVNCGTKGMSKESMKSFFNKMENSFGFQRAYDIQKYENRMHLSFAKLTSQNPLEKIEQIVSFVETSLSNEK